METARCKKSLGSLFCSPRLFLAAGLLVASSVLAFTEPASFMAFSQARAATGAAPASSRALVRVRFEGLSPLASVAEAQKDVLWQVLREVSPTQGVFLEWDDSQGAASLETPGTRITLRCRPCAAPRANDTFLPTSLEVQSSAALPTGANKRVRFAVSSPRSSNDSMGRSEHADNFETSWQVEIENQEPRYVVRLVQDVRAGDIMTLGHAEVETCYGTRSCGNPNAFRREAEAFTFHESAVGQEATRSLPIGGSLSPRDLRPPLVVRIGDVVSVRVIGGSESMLIRTRGRALQQGKTGDSILVETSAFGGTPSSGPSNSRRTLQAVVTGKGEVEYALQ